MAEFYAGGRATDLILFLPVPATAILLILWYQRSRWLAHRASIFIPATGGALMPALCAALKGAPRVLGHTLSHGLPGGALGRPAAAPAAA